MEFGLKSTSELQVLSSQKSPTGHHIVNKKVSPRRSTRYGLFEDSTPIRLLLDRIGTGFLKQHSTGKCSLILLYSPETSLLNKADLRSLNFDIDRLLIKSFRTNNMDIIQSDNVSILPHTSKVLFLALAVMFFFVFFFWFVTHISRERLNGFAPNSQGRRVWSLARKNLNVKVKGQGHRDKKVLSTPITPRNDEMERARCQ